MDRGIQEEETDLTDHNPLANIQALRYSADLLTSLVQIGVEQTLLCRISRLHIGSRKCVTVIIMAE